MGEASNRKRRWKRRHTIAVAAGTAIIAGGIALALGPGAAWVVDHGADGRRVWRLGHVEIEGVTGDWLGDLRIAHLTLADEQGVWAEAHDVALDWRPFDLLTGKVRINAAHAERITLLRRPVLLEPNPISGASFDVRLDGVRIDHLDVAEPVFGTAANFTADLVLEIRDETPETIDLSLARLDSDADRAVIRYRSGAAYALHVDVASAPGGVLARALGVSEDGLRLSAEGDGDAETGGARFDGAIGDAPLGSGALTWTRAGWELGADARLGLLPATQGLAERFGESVTLQASGVQPGAFEAHAATPFLTLDLAGALDEEMALVGPTRVIAETARLFDIAHEAPFEGGAARFEGELTRDDTRTTVTGTLDAHDLEIIGTRARFTGPIRAQLTDARFELEANLDAPAGAPALFAGARLETNLDYDRSSRRFTLSRATLAGDALELDAQGWANRGDGEFAGAWRSRKLETLWSDLHGAAGGNWRANAVPTETGERVWSITLDGDGAGVRGDPDVLSQLLGSSPAIDAMLRIENGGVTVSHARVSGAKLRAGATGRIVNGEANLALEASARGPLDLGGAVISGVVDGTGRLTGRLVRPTLEAQAQLASLTASGVEIVQPLVMFTLAPAGDQYRGQAEMHGLVQGQTSTGASSLVIDGNGIALPELVASIGALEARGAARLSEAGPEAQLALSGRIDALAPGLSGTILGDVALTPQTVTLDAQIANARAGELFIRAATVNASGPYSAIAARFDLRGRLRQAPLAFAGTALISNENGTQARIEGEGALAGAAIATRAPLDVSWTDGGLDAALDFAVADGRVTGRWAERGRALTGSVVIEEAPLAPLAAIWGERATGRIAGRIALTSGGGGLSGSADVNLIDARVAGRQRGALTAHIVADLDPTRLHAQLDAQSSDGLVAHLEANAPVVTSAAPIRIALAPERRGRATWTISGPVENLWAAARMQDQSLSGAVEGAGELSFGAGSLTGDGHLEIRDGRFEDKVTGVKLEALQARIAIGDDGVSIERFTANDSRGGTITATGGSANPREGHIALQIQNLRLVDRPDARARASGTLNFEWEGLDSTLAGTLDIAEADIDVASQPEAGIPHLDVIEINRPGDEDDMEEAPAPQGSGATRLDVRINAPGRIFTRGRGLEAEWSLALRLTGTSAAPRFFGEARAIRGTLSLSGQPFEIQTGRIVFDGEPADARIELNAERDSADLTARISLTGTAADPDIAFSSDPALPEDEILPQILFGRSVADLSALEAAQLAASLAALSGQASFDLVDAARAAAGLDRFNVREDEDGGLLVAGGVYLTRDVYVEIARTGLGQAATRVEWTIRPQLVLITSFLGNGDQRASIRWRRETD
jgi:translocation and assembly module TamB